MAITSKLPQALNYLAFAVKRWQGGSVAIQSNLSILVGDIGGTNTRLALYDAQGNKPVTDNVFPSQQYAGFEDIARPFLVHAQGPHPKVAVLGIAGPIKEGVATATNLSWKISERDLSKRLEIPHILLVNDLVVAARGCLELKPSSLTRLTERRPHPKGRNVAVIAAGTGLGEARLIWDGTRHIPLSTEGGHCDFAPQTPLQIELWHFLSSRYPDHVSYERVLSGDGIGALFDFFVSRAGRIPRTVERRLAQGDRNAAITELGLARSFRPAARAIDLFADIYGTEAGNLALGEFATGGIFVSGNIARLIIPERRELFMKAFLQKGRFRSFMAEIPVAVVMDPFVGVKGALTMAKTLLEQELSIATKSRLPSKTPAQRKRG